jgi:hypothetical protein
MMRKKPTQRFWAMLALINGVAVACPIYFVLGTDSDSAKLVSVFALVGVVFFLTITDAISIFVAYEL